MELKIILAIALISACVFLFPYQTFSQQQQQTTPVVSGNASKTGLNIPSNVSRIEITLKNDQSNQKSSLDTVLPAVAAVVGTSIGSFMTYLLTKKLKIKKQRELNKNKKSLIQISETGFLMI
jgi:membrane protein YqaA with SNARE-associated domain